MAHVDEAIASTLAYVPGYFGFQQRYQPFVGAQVAARVDGKVLLNHAVGSDDLAAAMPLFVNHLFRIASHSKMFIDLACMQLVEQGKLRLDDRACGHVPELKGTPMWRHGAEAGGPRRGHDPGRCRQQLLGVGSQIP